MNNGRVNIMEPDLESKFNMQDKIPIKHCVDYRDALTGNWTSNTVSDEFFSAKNISVLQHELQTAVSQLSQGQYVIGPQECDTLKIIMRAMYLQHAVNLPYDIPQQVAAINKIVIEFAAPRILSEIEGYMKYRRDVSNMYMLIPPPTYADHNDKTLEMKPWF